MPRQARLEAPGTLHHSILRGMGGGRSWRIGRSVSAATLY